MNKKRPTERFCRLVTSRAWGRTARNAICRGFSACSRATSANVPPPPCEINRPHSDFMFERLGFQKCSVYSKRCLPFQRARDRKGKSRTPEQSNNKKKISTTVALLCLSSFASNVPVMFQSRTSHEILYWRFTGFCVFMTRRLGTINFARGGRV